MSSKSILAATVLAALASHTSAIGVDLYWSGSGTWGVDSLWATSPGGTYNQAWTPGANAIFEGSPGTVDVSGNINVANLTFNTNADNYLIQGGTLDFAASSTITRTGGANREHKITSAITGRQPSTRTSTATRRSGSSARRTSACTADSTSRQPAGR